MKYSLPILALKETVDEYFILRYKLILQFEAKEGNKKVFRISFSYNFILATITINFGVMSRVKRGLPIRHVGLPTLFSYTNMAMRIS